MLPISSKKISANFACCQFRVEKSPRILHGDNFEKENPCEFGALPILEAWLNIMVNIDKNDCAKYMHSHSVISF